MSRYTCRTDDGWAEFLARNGAKVESVTHRHEVYLDTNDMAVFRNDYFLCRRGDGPQMTLIDAEHDEEVDDEDMDAILEPIVHGRELSILGIISYTCITLESGATIEVADCTPINDDAPLGNYVFATTPDYAPGLLSCNTPFIDLLLAGCTAPDPVGNMQKLARNLIIHPRVMNTERWPAPLEQLVRPEASYTPLCRALRSAAQDINGGQDQKDVLTRLLTEMDGLEPEAYTNLLHNSIVELQLAVCEDRCDVFFDLWLRFDDAMQKLYNGKVEH